MKRLKASARHQTVAIEQQDAPGRRVATSRRVGKQCLSGEDDRAGRTYDAYSPTFHQATRGVFRDDPREGLRDGEGLSL